MCKYAVNQVNYEFAYIDWYRLVGDSLDHLWIREYALLTHDAPKKLYFASCVYTLLEVGAQIIFAHELKNLTNVCSVNLHVRLFVHIPAMDEHIVEVTRCEYPHRSQQICHTSVERCRGVNLPRWHH